MIRKLSAGRRVGVSMSLLTGMALILASCQKSTSSGILSATSDSSSNSSASVGGTTGGGTTSTPVGTFALQADTLTAFNLGTSQTISAKITADQNYTGTVSLAVSTPELALIDKGRAITFTVNPSSVSLTPGSSATVAITVNVSTQSPDFASSLFHLTATDMSHPSGQAFVTSTPVSLQVNAVYVVNIITGAEVSIPEVWTVPAKATVSFINHPKGLTISFNDLDMNATKLPRIHSSAASGTIAHQPAPGLNQSLDGKTPNPNDGTYTQTVTIQTEASDQIYDHNFESGTEARNFVFNVPLVVASPTPSMNADATFTYINTNVLQPMCVSCHNPTTKAGGYDFSTYAQTILAVQAGDIFTSALYGAVQGGSMPLNGTPLSSALVQDIGDWINAGAPNN